MSLRGCARNDGLVLAAYMARYLPSGRRDFPDCSRARSRGTVLLGAGARASRGMPASAIARASGCRVWVKTGHLARPQATPLAAD
jgi:hypothetical protein